VCAQLRGPLSGLKFRWCEGSLLENATLLAGAELVKLRADGDCLYKPRACLELPPPIITDCCLFIQTLAILTQSDSSRHVFGVGRLSPWVALSYSGHDKDNLALPGKGDKPETLRVHYLSYANEGIRDMLFGRVANSGQWLAGPDSQRRYLGMTRDGPRRMPLDEWFERLVDGLNREWKNASGSFRKELDVIVPYVEETVGALKYKGHECWILGTSPL